MIENNIIQSFLIKKNISLLKAINKIKKNNEKFKSGKDILLVVEKNKFYGTLTEGDIRRYLIKNKFNKNFSVNQLINKNPIYFFERDKLSEIKKKIPKELKKRNRSSIDYIEHIPILNEKFFPIKIINFLELEDTNNIYQQGITNHINIYGLGYVGLTFALNLARYNFSVHGYDIDQKKINFLNKKKLYFYERGISSVLDKLINKKLFVSKQIYPYSMIHVIAVGTNIDKNKKLNQRPIINCINKIAPYIKKNSLVLIRSTLPIGYTENVIVKSLAKKTKLKPGEDFYIANVPERTLTGDAMNELNTLPQIIGGINSKSIDLACEVFKKIGIDIVRVENSKTAELAKLANNSARDNHFAFSNEISRICSKYNIDVYKVLSAANLGYPRHKISIPSPGVGGSCLTKDPYLLSYADNKKNNIFVKSRKINESFVDFQILRLKKLIKTYKKNIKPNILICGLAFKGNPETSDTRDSTSVLFGKKLKKLYGKIYAFDPIVPSNQIKKMGFIPRKIPSGFKGMDVLLILNNHDSFFDINIIKMINKMNKCPIIFDGWNVFDQKQFDDNNNIYINLSSIKINVK